MGPPFVDILRHRDTDLCLGLNEGFAVDFYHAEASSKSIPPQNPATNYLPDDNLWCKSGVKEKGLQNERKKKREGEPPARQMWPFRVETTFWVPVYGT